MHINNGPYICTKSQYLIPLQKKILKSTNQIQNQTTATTKTRTCIENAVEKKTELNWTGGDATLDVIDFSPSTIILNKQQVQQIKESFTPSQTLHLVQAARQIKKKAFDLKLYFALVNTPTFFKELSLMQFSSDAILVEI